MQCTKRPLCSIRIMASQAVSGSGIEVFEIHSFIRGYHAYTALWTPTIGEVLLVKPEPTNEKDSNAVAVLKDDSIVGHVPRNLSPRLRHFLRRDVNEAFAEVSYWSKSEQGCRLWSRGTVYLSLVRSTCLYKQNERTSGTTFCIWTYLAS